MRSTRILHSLGIEMKETRKEEKEEERGVNPLLYFLPLFSYFLFSHPHTEREREISDTEEHINAKRSKNEKKNEEKR
jgi:hypothetical protein